MATSMRKVSQIQKCERMTRTEDNYLVYLRNKRVAKLVGIQRATPNEDDQEKVSWDATSDYKYVPVQSSQETFNASIYIFAYFAYCIYFCILQVYIFCIFRGENISMDI